MKGASKQSNVQNHSHFQTMNSSQHSQSSIEEIDESMVLATMPGKFRTKKVSRPGEGVGRGQHGYNPWVQKSFTHENQQRTTAVGYLEDTAGGMMHPDERLNAIAQANEEQTASSSEQGRKPFLRRFRKDNGQRRN